MQVSLDARPLHPIPDRHWSDPSPPAIPGRSYSKLVLWCLVAYLSCYLTASTRYSSGALIPECNGLSQFKEVREINLIAYPPNVQPTENHPDFNLNPGRCSRQPVRPSRHCSSESTLAHWATETGLVCYYQPSSWLRLGFCTSQVIGWEDRFWNTSSGVLNPTVSIN